MKQAKIYEDTLNLSHFFFIYVAASFLSFLSVLTKQGEKMDIIVPTTKVPTSDSPLVLRRIDVPIAPKQEDPIVKLVSYGVNLAIADPEKAEEFGKTCLVIGAVGLGILGIVALAKLLG